MTSSSWVALGLTMALLGCTEKYGLELDSSGLSTQGLQSFQVHFATGQDLGTEEAPLPFISGVTCVGAGDCAAGEQCVDTRCSRCFSLDVEAMGKDGLTFPYSGMLHADVTPGFIAPSTAYFGMESGASTGVQVCFNRTSGAGNVWVEHDGVVPLPEGQSYGQCNDGVDNDDNGVIDMADPGCFDPGDDLEAPVTSATGISESIYFDNPTIPQLQRTAFIRTSPMVDQEVRVDSGTLVVSNVVNGGFYVTDLSAINQPAPYASIFIFTFSAPEGVKLGDIVCWFSGGVQEHVGHTQVVFPSFWTHDPGDPDVESECERDISAFLGDALETPPAAGGVDLTDRLQVEGNSTMAIQANSELMEAYESSLVKVRNIKMPTRLIACDRDKNGIIQSGDEQNCRNDCQNDELCTDLEGFFEYSQWTGPVDGKKTMGFSVALAARLTPLAIDFLGQQDKQGLCTRETTPLGFLQYNCPPRVVESISGSLRHVFLCNNQTGSNSCRLQFWILDPRFDGDVVLPSDLDQDDDGFTPDGGDCNDNNPSVNPNAAEVDGNGVDDDCDGESL